MFKTFTVLVWEQAGKGTRTCAKCCVRTRGGCKVCQCSNSPSGVNSPFCYHHFTLKVPVVLRCFISAFPGYSVAPTAAGGSAGLGRTSGREGHMSPFSTSLLPLCVDGPTAIQQMASPKTCQSPFPGFLCHLYCLPRQGLLAMLP